MNLLNIRWIHALFRWRWFPIIPQSIMLFVFGLIIAGGLGVDTTDMDFAMVLRNTNLANLIVWAYWWPMIVISAVLLGRFWCMVCPMELVSSLLSRFGLRRKVPNMLRSKWLVTVFYIAILLVGVYTFAIHRVPRRMAVYMLILFGTVAVTSVIFEKRAFCSYICPIGHLLGLYSCVSILQWRTKDLTVCKACKTKQCVAKKDYYRLIGHSCTSNLYPPAIKDSRNCLLCTQCLKVCPNDNLQLVMRKPFADFFSNFELRSAEAGFILVVSGFLLYDILPEWHVSGEILMWLPNHLVNLFGVTGILSKLLSGSVLFIVLPALIISAPVALAKLFSRLSANILIRAFALMLLPTVAVTHMVKAVFKMVSRLPYLKYAFYEPKGIKAATAIYNKTEIVDKSVLNVLEPIASYIGVVVLLFTLIVTFLMVRKSPTLEKLNAGAKFSLLGGVCFFWIVIMLTFVMWRF